MKKNFLLGLLPSACLALPMPLMAADDDLYFNDLPVVATVSRLPQQLSETPAAVTVIDREMIRASSMRTVEDLLRLVPGFQVTSREQSPAIATYHGLNNGLDKDEYGPRIQVLIDGRSQYSPLFKSGVNWSLLPVALENIERIEVTRGANTVSYGSNAFLGVVNIVTIDPSLTEGWTLASNIGNNGIHDNTLRWGGGIGDAKVRLTHRAQQDDGFQQAYFSKVNGLPVWTGMPDSTRSQMTDLRVDVPLDRRDELRIAGTFVRDLSQAGTPDQLSDPLRNLEQSSAAVSLEWRRTQAWNDEYSLRYDYVEDRAQGSYLAQDTFTLTDNSKPPMTFAYQPGGRSVEHHLEFERRLVPFANARAVWGLGGRWVSLVSQAQFANENAQHRSAYRGFGNLEYRPVAAWLFNLGGSLEHDSRVGWMFDPRGSVSYHVAPEHTLRFVLSRAHRSPSLYELAGRVEQRDISGGGWLNIGYLAQGVEPERIDTVELGYLADLKAWKASLDVRAFIEKIPNRIQILPLALPASAPDDQDWTVGRQLAVLFPGRAYTTFPYGRADGAANIEDVRIHGWEAQMQWRPFDGTRLIYNRALVAIDAEITNPWIVAEATGDVFDKISAQTRESTPVHSQSAMLIQKLPYEITASAMYFRASPMRWRRNGDPIEASERLDWRLAKAFRVGGSRAEVAYTVQMANEDQQGRHVARLAQQMQWLSLRLDF